MKNKMQELVTKLNDLANAYYNEGESGVSDHEYDALKEELEQMEKETGIVLPNSPTVTVGAKVENGRLEKAKHQYPALSLDKTKDIELMEKKMAQGEKESGRYECVIMPKCDGATLQATYQNGKLAQLLTRGDGIEGSVITHNAKHIKGLPLKIDYKGTLVVRGEGVMTFKEFERINASLPEGEKPYKNARNLCSASISVQDSNDIKDREIWFQGFNLVHKEDMPELFSDRLDWLKKQGFNVVPYEVTNTAAGLLKEKMQRWEANIPSFEFPLDGLVICLNNAKYTDMLPGTGHNPHIYSGYAFKFTDEVATTTLRAIEFSASRTGLLNPVAVFDPVELEGTTVQRASLHNISYILTHDLRIGAQLDIIKANKIIPMVVKNHNKELEWNGEMVDEERKSRNSLICDCPICGHEVVYKFTKANGKKTDTMVAVCENEDCNAKKIGAFVKFASRDGLNIFGMSEETITKFIKNGWLEEFSDFWHLDRYKDKIVQMEGFGETSYNNFVAAVEQSRKVDFIHFINALGIPNVGRGQARLLKNYLESKKEAGQSSIALLADEDIDFTECDGIGDVISQSIKLWRNTDAKAEWYLNLLLEIEITDDMDTKVAFETSLALEGKVFVITGSLNGYANRDELKAKIEALGGKVSGSVSKKTSYLINNDVTSTSGKNKKALELGVPIISEESFETMIM